MSYTKIPRFKGFTRKQVLSYARMMIRTENEWARKALIILDRLQTDDERRHGQSFHENRKGYSGRDAPFLTFMAVRARKKNWYYRTKPDKLKMVREKVAHYVVQLVCKADKVKLMVGLHRYYEVSPEKRGIWK